MVFLSVRPTKKVPFPKTNFELQHLSLSRFINPQCHKPKSIPQLSINPPKSRTMRVNTIARRQSKTQSDRCYRHHYCSAFAGSTLLTTARAADSDESTRSLRYFAKARWKGAAHASHFIAVINCHRARTLETSLRCLSGIFPRDERARETMRLFARTLHRSFDNQRGATCHSLNIVPRFVPANCSEQVFPPMNNRVASEIASPGETKSKMEYQWRLIRDTKGRANKLEARVPLYVCICYDCAR